MDIKSNFLLKAILGCFLILLAYVVLINHDDSQPTTAGKEGIEETTTAGTCDRYKVQDSCNGDTKCKVLFSNL